MQRFEDALVKPILVVMQEYIFKHKHVDLIYKEKPSVQDRRHLLVIFTGFKLGPMTGYDFQGNAIKSYKGNVLWIKEDFDGICSYYLCRNMNFTIEEAVIALINKKLDELQLDKNECTLAGFSKGGTAALYFGVKYDFENIISTVPRFGIGSFVSSSREVVAEHMMGSVVQKNIDVLDGVLPNQMDADNNTKKNIYLFSLKADFQYKTEILPNLHRFEKYSNFNFILTDSPLVREHNEVTRYNLPLILSIMYSLCEGCPPSYGKGYNGGRNASKQLAFNSQDKVSIALLKNFKFEESIFYPEGDAFIQGVACPEYGTQNKKLIFESENNSYVFKIGSTKDKNLSCDYFKKEYIDYLTGGFASNGHKGVDLSSLADGLYSLSIDVSAKNIDREAALKSKKEIDFKVASALKLYHLYTESGVVKLIKRSIFGEYPNNAVFTVNKSWQKDSKYHLEGIFKVSGIELQNWNDALYILTLQSKACVKTFHLGMCHRPFITKNFGDGYAVYDKAYYSTFKGEGVDISDLPKGDYQIYITMSHKKSLFTKQVDGELNL